MSVMRTLILVFGLWVYAFVIVAVYNLVNSNMAIKVTSAETFFCYWFTMVIMIGLNIKLFMIAKYHLEREPPSPEREAKRSSFYLIIVVSGFFLATWFPTILHVSLCDFIVLPCQSFEKEGTAVLKFLPRINAAITPVLYVCACTPLKHSLLKVWKTACSCVRSTSMSTSETAQSFPQVNVAIISKGDI